MIVRATTGDQVDAMLHAIGYAPGKVKDGTYTAYRNSFFTNGIDHSWERLVQDGKATGQHDHINEMNPNARVYSVTRVGMDFLEIVTGIKIREGD